MLQRQEAQPNRHHRFRLYRLYGKLVLSVAGLVALAVLLAALWMARTHQSEANQQREPSSIEEDTLEDLLKAQRSQTDEQYPTHFRHKASLHSVMEPFSDIQHVSVDEARMRTGILAKRAQSVRYNAEALTRLNQQGGQVSLKIFGEKTLTLQFAKPSYYGVNHFLYTGTVAEDPSAQVRWMSADQALDATIETSDALYRIVDAGSGRHFIVEVDSQKDRNNHF